MTGKTVTQTDGDAPENASSHRKIRFRGGLSARLLRLTFLFVMLAEVLIFVPSVANMRLNWLSDRLNTAAAAAVVVNSLAGTRLPDMARHDMLMATDTKAIVLTKDGMRHLIAIADMPPEVDFQYNLAEMRPFKAIYDAFDELLFGGQRVIRVFGPVGKSSMLIEVVMGDAELRSAMFQYSINVFSISLVISLFSGALIFMAINRIMIRPIRRISTNLQGFSERPDDPASVFTTEEGKDELALTGQQLAGMQRELQKTLRQQKNLADLGLAVSKINHDMRNMLASAQLISDRLSDTDDPMVKRLAPKLLRAIDRAVGYSNSVLSFGKANEAEPKRRLLRLKMLVQDVCDLMGIEPETGIEFEIHIADDLTVDADPDQLFRAIHNLCRNAVQALMNEPDDGNAVIRRITVSAYRAGSVVGISVDDTGPGMPQKARENLFKPFRGSARSGGTGLGLAIAREIVLAHGGTIALVEKAQAGTQFRIEIPDRPIAMDNFRNKPGMES